MILALFLHFALGLAFALAGRDRVRVDGLFAQPAFPLVLIHVALVTAPVALYFYAAHGEWSWLYLVDPDDVPGLAVLPLVVVHGLVVVGGWYLGGFLVRRDRPRVLVWALVGASATFCLSVALALPRVLTASSYAGYRHGVHRGLMGVELGWALVVSIAATAAASAYVLVELSRDSRRVRTR